ncbi:UNKNOWN [Stylonychia lemnae]|uniref:Transmembrane protein n=1 Tax=Stylonychia lemnae TaxID=5949 RepID=A0A078B7N1_STYLE|nr:UNKNOWN [Stylonychia lemnae]|eukprot:CDW89563.1 UNKNOWN [Stylonychia lemnae]
MDHSTQPQKSRSKCKKFFKPIDIYGKPISLTYGGREQFKTTFGGSVSFLVVLLFLSVTFYKLNDMVNKNLTVVKKNTLVSISNSYTPPEDLSKKHITFAFMLSNIRASEVFDDKRHGQFHLTQVEVEIKQNLEDGTFYREFINSDVPISNCEIGRNFFYPNIEEVTQYNTQNYFCPDWQNLTIQGSWYSPVFKYVQLTYQRCDNQNCSDEEEFQQWFQGKWIQQIIISSYFNIGDYDEPVKYFLDDSYQAVEYGRTTYNNVFFKKNELKLSDNLIGFFNDLIQQYFYQMSVNKVFYSSDTGGVAKGIYYRQDVKLDKEYDVYERQVYSISSLLQYVGGIYNSLFFIGLFILSRFRSSLYFASLISKLYQIEHLKKNNLNGIQKEKMILDLENSSAKIMDISQEFARLNSQTSRKYAENLQKEIESNNWNVTAIIAKKLINYLGNRWRLSITTKDVLSFSFQKFHLCCRQKHLNSDSIMQIRKIILFNKGQKKVKQELDAINIINRLRKLDLLLSLFLSKDQSFLLQFQKKNLIQENDSSSEDDRKNPSRILRKFSSQYFRRNQDRNTLKQLEEAVYQYSQNEKLEMIDKKILNGLLTKKKISESQSLSTIKKIQLKESMNESSDFGINKIEYGKSSPEKQKEQKAAITRDNNNNENILGSLEQKNQGLQIQFQPLKTKKNRKTLIQNKKIFKQSCTDVAKNEKGKQGTQNNLKLDDILTGND